VRRKVRPAYDRRRQGKLHGLLRHAIRDEKESGQVRIKAPMATHCCLSLSQKIRLALLPSDCVKRNLSTPAFRAKDKGRFAKVRGLARTAAPTEAHP
jgi:hypothetical protein